MKLQAKLLLIIVPLVVLPTALMGLLAYIYIGSEFLEIIRNETPVLALVATAITAAVSVGGIISHILRRTISSRVNEICHEANGLVGDIDIIESLATTSDEIESIGQSMVSMQKSIQDHEKTINDLAYYDHLTGLANRFGLNAAVNEALYTAEACHTNIAVMMIDLDNFKEINAAYSNTLGDIVLKSISTRIHEEIEAALNTISPDSADFILCRISGDEFTVVLHDYTSTTIVEKIAKTVLSAISSPLAISGQQFRVGANLGIATYPSDGNKRHLLLHKADMALKEAKAIGKNRYLFYQSSMSERLNEQRALCKDIKRAVASDEFTLYFQPKVNIKSNTISEFEALIRWSHPQKGEMAPSVFIPFAEENGLINLIGNWVFESLCRHIKELEESGRKNFKISFNTSPQQLQDDLYIQNIEKCIARYGINPTHLEMEITEYSLAKDLADTIHYLNKIKEMGISISLDDFGTGYSSLSYLEKLPIDTIKIDRSFVHSGENWESKTNILAAIVMMAKGLKMKTVAEGVETQEELDMAQSKGCDYIQGFFFFPPLSFDDMRKIPEELGSSAAA